MSALPTIVTHALTKRFGAFTAVDTVSLEVHAGEVFGFLGSNGCGKTTTIRMLCGLLRPSGGSGSVAGFDIARQAEAIRARAGYVAQFFNLYGELTVRENLEFYGGVYGVPRRQLGPTVDEWIGRLELGRWQSVRARNLSTGLKRSLALAAAVLHQPAVLLLDEPTSGVDPLARRAFFDIIGELAERGTSILVTTHVMDEAERCHRLALMNRGRIVAEGTPAEVKALTGGQLYCYHATPAGRALELAESHPTVESAALFGRDLQVLFRDGAAPAAALAGWLREQGVATPEPEPVRATIEHAFLEILRRDEQQPGARQGGSA